MPEPEPARETGPNQIPVQRWSAPDCPFVIDCSIPLITRLRQQAVAGMHMLPHGGLEVAGLLFGRVFPNARAPQRIEIVAERSIECGHGEGPAFILSDAERDQIAVQLQQTRMDSELSGLSILGFWVSHSRSNLELSPYDLELYRLFPNNWQSVLIFKPAPGALTRVNFAFRAGGQVRRPDPQQEFTAEDTGSATRGLLPLRITDIERGREEQDSLKIRAKRSVPLYWAVLLIVLAFVAGVAVTYLWPAIVSRFKL